MYTSTFFHILLFIGIILPLIAFIMLSILKLIEKEFDYLSMENKQIQLEKQLQQMEHDQLSQQIQPHFLYNSLNAMTSLARLNRNEALVSSMEKFSLFLRYQSSQKQSLVSFQTEWEHSQNYLAIQQIRFGEKLLILIHIDPLAYDTLLPTYTLQTFLENAFKHGLEKKRGLKKLEIQLERNGNWVSLKVRDNGTEEINFTHTQGIGLANIRKRMRLLFDLKTKVSIAKNNEWTEVEAIWPYTPEDYNEFINRR